MRHSEDEPLRLAEPIDRFVGIVSGRFKADIIIALGKGARRFVELRKAVPGISERALARQLDALERDGVVARDAFAETPPRVEYSLTKFGSTLCPLLKSIWVWGSRSAAQTSAAAPPPGTTPGQ